MRTAVVGHTEWVEFGRVGRVPGAGEIAHTTDAWEEPGGGGAVAAVHLAGLTGSCTFYTALGDDERGEWCRRGLEGLGVRVEAALRDEPTRRAITLVDADGERTITTFGRRLEPSAADRLPWNELEDVDAAFATAGNAGAIREARRARVLVATSRAMLVLAEADVHLDAIVGSRTDPAERFEPEALTHPPHLLVRTDGARGGRYETSDGRSGTYLAAAPPGPVVDTYGAGEAFAAGLAYGLAAGLGLDATIALAARCGAWNVAGRGPYGRRLLAADLAGAGA
ncbi:MAG TPA: PfkB family carbohydrate kinase [Actinomycetota bacterium]|nr:PfkB family carbohydrate kinase [Actinomycetota bacterium]